MGQRTSSPRGRRHGSQFLMRSLPNLLLSLVAVAAVLPTGTALAQHQGKVQGKVVRR